MAKPPKRLELLLALGILAVLAFSMLGTYLLYRQNAEIRSAESLLAEAQRPAVLQAVVISAECEDCSDLTPVIDAIRGQNANITSVKTLSATEGADLVRKYRIDKLPALILTGEVTKTDALRGLLEANGDIIDDNTFVFGNTQPPYYDLQTDAVLGRVSLISITDASCANCTSFAEIPTVLQNADVRLSSQEEVSYDSERGRQLVRQYGIRQVPALLLSEDIEVYGIWTQANAQMNLNATDGFYSLPANPPYRDLVQKRVVGYAELILINDSACKECYDVSIIGQALPRMGMTLTKTTVVDAGSTRGKEYIAQYGIAAVPSALVSPDTKYYPTVVAAWEEIGTQEQDGWFVLRKPEALGSYRDLRTGEVVTPTQG